MDVLALIFSVGIVVGILALVGVYGAWIKFCVDNMSDRMSFVVSMLPAFLLIVVIFYLMLTGVIK